MPKINENNKLYWLYIVGFFIILALPLLDLPPWFSPPDWSKGLVFRSLMAIMFFVFLVTLKIRKETTQKLGATIRNTLKNPVSLPVLALICYFFIVLLSTLFSLNITKSLWDTPERGDGFINFSFLIIFCLLGFLLIKKQDWKKILDFSLVIAFLVSLIAFFQQFGILSQIFQSTTYRPAATLGNPIILSLYLLFFFFLALSLFISEKRPEGSLIKKNTYLFLIFFYSFIIVFITQTRAAYLGLLVGFLWFFMTYPILKEENKSKIKKIKIGAIAFIALVFVSLLFINKNPSIIRNWNPIFKDSVSRALTITQGIGVDASRVDTWKIAGNAFIERPFWGYGPSNFSIAYLKYYNPGSSLLKHLTFDRAHNSLIEILIASGIFALAFYLILFFSILWQLQKIKKAYPVSHGLQAGFLAFFVASLASIEGFSSFLILFLFISYSLHLISQNYKDRNQLQQNIQTNPKTSTTIKLPKLASAILFFILFLFLWQYNLKPFQINLKINAGQYLSETKEYDKSFEMLEQISKTKSILSSYSDLIYTKALVSMAQQQPQKQVEISEKIADIAEKNLEFKSHDMGNWLRLGEALTILAKEKNNTEMAKRAQNAFEKAWNLSPKNETVILASFFADVFLKDFSRAQEKSVFCLTKMPETSECVWMSGLLKIYQNKNEEGELLIEKAKEMGYFLNYYSNYPGSSSIEEIPLNQLLDAYAENRNYQKLSSIYEKLVEINPSNFQYKASLAFVYKELREYQKARETALSILKTNPEMEPQVNAFLQNLY